MKQHTKKFALYCKIDKLFKETGLQKVNQKIIKTWTTFNIPIISVIHNQKTAKQIVAIKIIITI
ncbi:MAG: hypothetical protein D6B27_01160 [Gammaproteobacteria bacterium]|nr:MAG: hypothetical protein D6B27_01160 [Gammaproteobacteria bacterium]